MNTMPIYGLWFSVGCSPSSQLRAPGSRATRARFVLSPFYVSSFFSSRHAVRLSLIARWLHNAPPDTHNMSPSSLVLQTFRSRTLVLLPCETRPVQGVDLHLVGVVLLALLRYDCCGHGEHIAILVQLVSSTCGTVLDVGACVVQHNAMAFSP